VAIAPSIAEAGHYRNDGTYVGRPSGAVTSLFAQFPGGGQGLADAIAQLLISDPALADDVAFVAVNSANADQQSAAGAGMAQAEAALRDSDQGGASARIARAARASGGPILVALAGGLGGGTGGGLATGIFLPANNGSTANSSQNCVTTPGNTTVSPATPPVTVCH
jgi:hypothetical protein